VIPKSPAGGERQAEKKDHNPYSLGREEVSPLLFNIQGMGQVFIREVPSWVNIHKRRWKAANRVGTIQVRGGKGEASRLTEMEEVQIIQY